LRNNPQFQQLRQVVQQQPAMLEPILQQVAQGNPQLGNLIMQNQQAFMELLAEDTGDDDVQLPPGAAHEIAVTEEERDAIERVCSPRLAMCKLFPPDWSIALPPWLRP
jgi:UV excision repair protein RAD23